MDILKKLFQNSGSNTKESPKKEYVYNGTYIHMRNTKKDSENVDSSGLFCVYCGQPLKDNEVAVCSKCISEL